MFMAKWSLFTRRPPVEYTEDERKVFEATKKIGPAILVAVSIGGIALLAWAVGQGYEDGDFSCAKFLKAVGLFTMVAGASGAVGALLGFLFGVPRTREAAEAARQGQDARAVQRAVLAANTNLERVSDWLTTLLLGATLVQIQPLAKWIGELGKGLKTDPAETLMPIIVVYFLVLGFLGVYLMTRLYLTYALQLMLRLGLEAEGAPSVAVLTTQLTDALATNGQARLRDALAAFEKAKARPEVGADAGLNALAARAAGRRAKTAGIDAAEKATLEATMLGALAAAVADPKVKQAIATDAEQKKDLEGLDAAVQPKVDDLLK
jgi:hypothetical protein